MIFIRHQVFQLFQVTLSDLPEVSSGHRSVTALSRFDISLCTPQFR